MKKKIAIIQSNYIPWKGYFDMIAAVDEFIQFDEVQYTKGDWRNRNKIKTPQGVQWLTVPVQGKRLSQKIIETKISGNNWTSLHWKSIVQNYRRATYFSEIASWLEPIYHEESFNHISQLNYHFIKSICQYLAIDTKITSSTEYHLTDGKTERLANLCTQAGGTEYISGPAAKNYIDEKVFKDRDIKLTWFDYAGYPSYSQLWGDFVHEVTILDLLFNCGKKSSRYMRYVK